MSVTLTPGIDGFAAWDEAAWDADQWPPDVEHLAVDLAANPDTTTPEIR